MENLSLPFKIDEVFGGLAETQGILSLRESHLKLQYQTKDALFGMMKSAIKESRVSFGEIEEACFKKGFFSSKLTLRFSSMATLPGLKGEKPGEVCLKVEKKYADIARDFESKIRLQVADLLLKNAYNS